MQGFYEIMHLIHYYSCIELEVLYMHFTLNSVTALDSYSTIPIMYVYGFADCVDNGKHMQGYIKMC